MDSFDTATVTSARADGRFVCDAPDGWEVGRGAWGGLVVGAPINAVTESETGLARVVRSVSAEIASPALVGSTPSSPPSCGAVRLCRRGT